MPAINSAECFITSTLNAIFHQKESMLIDAFQIPEQSIRHTIRASADDQRLFIFPFQRLQFAVCICISLKVGQILHFRIFMGEETFSFLQLQTYRFLCAAVVRIKSLVIAIGTTAISFISVTIGTSETCIQRNFLHFIWEITFQKRGKFIITRCCTHSSIIFKSKNRYFTLYITLI